MTDAILPIKRGDLDKIRKTLDSGQFPVVQIDGFGAIMFTKDPERGTLRLGFATKETITEDSLRLLGELADRFRQLLYPGENQGRQETYDIGAIDLDSQGGEKTFLDMLGFKGEFPATFRGSDGKER